MLDSYTTAVLDAQANIKIESAKNSVLALFLDEFGVINNASADITDGMFAICHTIIRNHGEDEVPAEWNFQLGANALDEEDRSIFELDIEYLPLSQLIEAGNVLTATLRKLDSVDER